MIDEAHLELFVRWVQFGGLQRGMTPTELAAMPAALLADFTLLLGKYNRRMKKRKSKANAAK